MMKCSGVFLVSALVGMVASAATAGCSGDVGNNTTGGQTTGTGGQGGGTTGTGGGGGAPECKSGEGTVLAISKLYFGDAALEWKKLGFNIDGKVSDPMSKDLCKPVMGSTTAAVYQDGENGIDNSFGANILPSLDNISQILTNDTFAKQANNNISDGKFTAMFKMACLPPMGDISPLTTKVYMGASLGTAPNFDGNDAWPVAPELLKDPMDLESSTVVFDKSSVKGELFDSGVGITFVLTIPLQTSTKTASFKLAVHSARVTMNLDANRKGATGGIVGGVLDTQEFINELDKAANALDVCGFADATKTTIQRASDILNDGTQDPMKECNGISIGIGFDMKEVKLGDVVAATPEGTPCSTMP